MIILTWFTWFRLTKYVLFIMTITSLLLFDFFNLIKSYHYSQFNVNHHSICKYFFIGLFSKRWFKRWFLKAAFKKAVGDSPTASINNGMFFRSAKSIYYFNVTIVRPFISPFKIFLQTSGNCSNVTSLAIDSNN